MKITKDMLNNELQNLYFPMKIFGFLLSKTWFIRLMNKSSAGNKGKNIEGLDCEERYIPSTHGDSDIRLRIYKPHNAPDVLPVMLYLHGGGYVLDVPENHHNIIKRIIEARACIVVAPDYRKALDAPYPAAFNDCYDSLLWINNHASELGTIPEKIIVAGHSAGGGLVAALSLKARDTGDVDIAFQMPIYPMIDDRQITDSSHSNAPLWNAKSNKFGWHHYLKGLRDDGDIPDYAAPARAKDYHNLPPTISFVGDLEPFRDETIAYIDNLKQADVPVAFELFKGGFHAFEVVAPQTKIGQSAWEFLLSNYNQFVDTYV